MLVKVPTGQSVGDVEPGEPTNEPGGAGAHGVFPVALKVPGAHKVAVDTNGIVNPVPPIPISNDITPVGGNTSTV